MTLSETVDLRIGVIRASGHLTAQGADLLRGTADSLREGGHRRGLTPGGRGESGAPPPSTGVASMGLFDRRATPSPSGEAPLIGAAERAEATALMDRWDAALGDSGAMFACLAHVAGRPWEWWAAASRAAGAAGEHALAGRIFLFAHLFTTRLVDRISPEKQRETGLARPDPAAYRAIAEQAVSSLVQLPPELMIHDTATGKVDVAAAWTMAQAVVAA